MAQRATLRQSGGRGLLVAPSSDVPERWGGRLERWIERLYTAADGFGVRRGWLPSAPEAPPEPPQGPLGDPADLPGRRRRPGPRRQFAHRLAAAAAWLSAAAPDALSSSSTAT